VGFRQSSLEDVEVDAAPQVKSEQSNPSLPEEDSHGALRSLFLQEGSTRSMRIHLYSIPASFFRVAARSLLISALLVAWVTGAFAHAASVYVPLDSWTYAASERLAVLTGTSEEVLGMRPWTREQFARFLERAREMPHNAEASGLQSSLEREFAPELSVDPESMVLESVYTRSMQIAGTPLRDSYHFGQTIADDFGRPYGQGFNNIEGASGYSQYRAGMIYVRGEYQHGASLRGPSQSAISVLAGKDEVCDGNHNLFCTTSNQDQVLTQGGPSVDDFRLLDTYVGTSFGRWTATLGKQSLWWGPTAEGAFLYTNNIEPIWMGRLTNDVPYAIPILGKMRLDMFYGRLQGHVFLPGVWIHGEKVSFEPSRSFQISFARSVQFLGVGRPLTFKRLLSTYFSVGDQPNADTVQNDPGDRKSEMDFSWKLPKYPATFYMDSYSDDEPSTINQPKRSNYHPGIYIARMPGKLAKLDLRVEGVYTASEDKPSISNGFNYWNGVYKDGYTNKGLLIGDTVGRAGVVWQAWSTYWLSARNKLQVSYRHQYISPQFIPGGGTQGDIRGTADFWVKRNLEVQLGVQSERVALPLLFSTAAPQYNTSAWAGLTYWPEHKVQLQ
jgi:hypothetical protein